MRDDDAQGGWVPHLSLPPHSLPPLSLSLSRPPLSLSLSRIPHRLDPLHRAIIAVAAVVVLATVAQRDGAGRRRADHGGRGRGRRSAGRVRAAGVAAARFAPPAQQASTRLLDVQDVGGPGPDGRGGRGGVRRGFGAPPGRGRGVGHLWRGCAPSPRREVSTRARACGAVVWRGGERVTPSVAPCSGVRRAGE